MMIRSLLLCVGLLVGQLAMANGMERELVKCERSRHASGNRVTITKTKAGDAFDIEVWSWRGWTRNLASVLGVPFEVRSVRFQVPKASCHQKSATQDFPMVCHAGRVVLTVANDEGKAETFPLYFAMLRLSPVVIDDMYDSADPKTVFGRLTFGTQKGHDVEIGEMFPVSDCSAK